jgi:multidrug efflux pump
MLLKPHGAAPDALTRFMEKYFGWLFDGFNNLFTKGSEKYQGKLRSVLHHRAIAMLFYVLLIAFTYFAFSKVPVSYVPAQDKAYLIAFTQLPSGATLDRTEAVIRKMADIGMKDPAVADAVQFPGLSIAGFSSNSSE